MHTRSAIDLTTIDAIALEKAICEYNDLGRGRFLDKYGFGPSTKFYFRHEDRIYDTKALVGAAYFHANGEDLSRTQFAGGAPTRAVFERLMKEDERFRDSEIFEDQFGELSNLSDEISELPGVLANIRDLGFSKWIPFERYKELHTRSLPGVYVIADCASPAPGMTVIDPAVVYIGQTVDQNLRIRLSQCNCSLADKDGHSGCRTLYRKGIPRRQLWLSIRAFPLGCGPEKEMSLLRSKQIQSLEQHLLLQYVRSNRTHPAGNSK